MRTVVVTTDLPAPAETVWHAVQTVAAFRYVTRGLVRLPALSLPEGRLTVGTSVSGRLWVLGVVPAHVHRLEVVELDDAARVLVTEESGGLLRRWRHTISVRQTGERTATYRDEVLLDAGRWTPLAVVVVTAFYRLRQRRWRRLAALLVLGSPAV